MALTTSAWGRPIQGVSQQPPKVRLEGQCEVQENAISSAVNGLYRRPGTRRINDLDQNFHPNTKFHYYNRGGGERYIIAIEPGQAPVIFDDEGDSLVVEMDAPTSYLSSSNPFIDLKLSTISDFTFIANKGVTPQEDSETSDPLSNTAIVYCQFADYGRTYRIVINGSTEASMKTPDGSESEHIEEVDTTVIATRLNNQLSTLSGFSTTRVGNTIFISRDNGNSFSVRTEDGADGKDLIAIFHSVSTVDSLPPNAPENYRIEILGQGGGDRYWLRAEGQDAGTVRWIETVAPGIPYRLDASTMPHALVRDRFVGGKAVFKFIRIDWDEREVGDSRTNPMPSFVQDQEPIRSVGTFQNRLFFTAGESVVYSQSNFFFNFFKTTVREDLDDSPVDVFADTNQVNLLENSAVLDGDVVFFSENGQFLQSGDNPMTQENATLRYASSFENTVEAAPVAAGDVIFFPFEYGRFTGIREFYTDSLTDTKRARPVTDHVDQYIQGKARLLATSTNRNQLLVLADDPDVVYVYAWIWEGQERVQSSWSIWRFPDSVIKFMAYDKETIFFVIERGGVTSIEYIETGDPDDIGLCFPVRLDKRFYTQATKLPSGEWEFESPYEGDVVFVRGEGTTDSGVSVDAVHLGGTSYITNEDLGNGAESVELIGGLEYETIFEPTMPFIRDNSGKVIDTDRLIINDVNINYDLTGLFFVQVKNDWGFEREYLFNGRRIGDISNIIGFAPLEPGQFSFPIRQDSDKTSFQIRTSSHLPFQLRDMEWRGRFRQRGRRV